MADLHIGVLLTVLITAVVLVILAGIRLAKVGDELVERTGLSRLFVGALFVAIATSLPELATDFTAAVADAPDLAIGDLFGSSMANMAILAIVDLRYRGRLLPLVELGHTRIAAIAIGLTALAVVATATSPGIDVAGIGARPHRDRRWVCCSARMVSAHTTDRRFGSIPHPISQTAQYHWSLGGERLPLAGFGLSALVLLLAAPTLTLTTEEVAHRSGIGQGVLGVTLLAMTTSLPELATSFAALRLGAHDLAVGNLLGSNAANMAMIVVVDAAYRPGPILAAVDNTHTIGGTGAILLMALALARILSGRANRAHRLEPDSIALLVAYVGTVIAVALAAE